MTQSNGLNIYIAIDFGTRSHVRFLFDMSLTLKEKGHNITYVSPIESRCYADDYDFNFIDYGASARPRAEIKDGIKKMNYNHYTPISTSVSVAELLFVSYESSFERIYKIIEQNEIDLLICDYFFIACIDAAKKINVPLIINTPSMDVAPFSHTSYTNPFSDSEASTSEETGLAGRARWIYKKLVYQHKLNKINAKINKLRNNRGISSSPLFGDMRNSLVLVNNFIEFETPRPTSPNLVFVGPVKFHKISVLDDHTKSYLENRRRVLYVAQGSINYIPEQHLKCLLEAIVTAYNKDLIDGVVWAMGIMTLDEFPKEVEIEGKKLNFQNTFLKSDKFLFKEWFPQPEILKHKNTILFLSHGGVESIFEAMNFGKPVLITPYFGDQHRNGVKVKERNIGDFIDLRKASTAEIFNKIKETINDISNKKKSIKHMQILTKYNSKRIGVANDFIEMYGYSAKICREMPNNIHSGIPCELQPYLPAGNRMSLAKKYSVDIWLSLSLLSIGFLFVFTMVFKRLRITFK